MDHQDYDMVQCSELKVIICLTNRTTTLQPTQKGRFFRSASKPNFCKHHKEDKGNSSVSVYVPILCIIV